MLFIFIGKHDSIRGRLLFRQEALRVQRIRVQPPLASSFVPRLGRCHCASRCVVLVVQVLQPT